MAFGEPLERLVIELAQQDAAATNRRRPGGVTVEVADAGDRAGRALRYPSVHGRAGAGSRGTGGSGPRPSPGGGGIREAHRNAVRSRRGPERGYGRRGYRRAGAVADLSWRRAARRDRGGGGRSWEKRPSLGGGA